MSKGNRRSVALAAIASRIPVPRSDYSAEMIFPGPFATAPYQLSSHRKGALLSCLGYFAANRLKCFKNPLPYRFEPRVLHKEGRAVTLRPSCGVEIQGLKWTIWPTVVSTL